VFVVAAVAGTVMVGVAAIAGTPRSVGEW
jgi:hypothetical protein